MIDCAESFYKLLKIPYRLVEQVFLLRYFNSVMLSSFLLMGSNVWKRCRSLLCTELMEHFVSESKTLY